MTINVNDDDDLSELYEDYEAALKAEAEAEGDNDGGDDLGGKPDNSESTDDTEGTTEKPAKDTDADDTAGGSESSTEESETDADTDPDTDANNDDSDQRVPIAALTTQRRAARKAEREAREAQAENEQLKKDIETLKLQGAVNGIDLEEALAESGGEFTDDMYLKIAEDEGQEKADLLRNQHLKQVEQDRRLKALETKSDPDSQEQPGFTQDEVTEAIDDNPTLAAWFANAGNGDGAKWDIAREIEQGLDGSFDNLTDRFAEVVKLTKAKIAESEKAATDVTSEGNVSLSDVSGKAGAQGESFDQFLELSGEQQMERFQKMNANQRRKIEEQLFS